MADDSARRIGKVIVFQRDKLLEHWMEKQPSAPTLRTDLMSEAELRQHSRQFLNLMAEAVQAGGLDPAAPEWTPVRDLLATVSRSRATQGFPPSETATFIFSFKQPLFAALAEKNKDNGPSERLEQDVAGPPPGA